MTHKAKISFASVVEIMQMIETENSYRHCTPGNSSVTIVSSFLLNLISVEAKRLVA
jgi:hypothetical protein